MGIFTSKKFETLDDVFLDELKDMYDAEHQLVEALPKMEEKARSMQLKQLFASHRAESQNHIARLERTFQLLDETPDRVKCSAMKGILAEGDEVIDATGNADVIDAALIACAQRVEHYEMAGYGTLRTFAQRLGYDEVAELMQGTLDEERRADKLLTSLALERVNPAADAANG